MAYTVYRNQILRFEEYGGGKSYCFSRLVSVLFQPIENFQSMQMSIQSLQQKIAEREHFQQLARTKLIATVDQSYVLVDKFVVRDKIRYEKNDINILYQVTSLDELLVIEYNSR